MAYDVSDPEDVIELAGFIDPDDAFRGTRTLDDSDTEVGDDGRFALGSDHNGRDIAVLELVNGGSGDETATPSAEAVRAARPSVDAVAPNAVADRLDLEYPATRAGRPSPSRPIRPTDEPPTDRAAGERPRPPRAPREYRRVRPDLRSRRFGLSVRPRS